MAGGTAEHGRAPAQNATHTPPHPLPFSSTPHPSPHRRGTALSRPQPLGRREPTTSTPSKSIDIHRHIITKQQSPTAKTRLSNLIALINRDRKHATPKSNMAEALLGLARSSWDDAPSNIARIAKPDDIPAQLLRDLELKRTPTRCEHVSVTLDVPNTVAFSIPENDADAQENLDPALGSFRSEVVDGQQVKVVPAYDVIIRQPQDDPVMQRAVAKHIVGLLSTVDESSWVVREVSMGQYGWTFTYICKDSMAMWNRQNGKNPKALIAEYSQKDLDPVLSARPAFDCRGTLTIAFAKNSRMINIKYEHSPLHKTVGEMIEHFRPLPPAPPPAPLIAAGDKKKTPRKKKPVEYNEDGTPKEPKPRKKKPVEYNEDGTPKEPKRKRKSAVNEDGTPSQPKKKRKKKSEANAEAPADGAENEDSQPATVLSKADAAVQSNVHSQVNLNVPPAEAARRREVAIRMLSDNGVDPETLSTEQFSIFANQSPDLQKESLAMLMRYGAERLRIVHPADAAAASSSTSASPVPEQPSSQADDSAAEPSEPPAEGKKKKKKAGSSKQESVDEELIAAPPGTPLKLVSRGGCIRCRLNKLKCDRGKPACETCEEEEVECQYPLVKAEANRRQSKLSAAQVISDDDAEAEIEHEPETEPEPAPEPQEEPDDIETIDYTSNMPVANMLTPAAEPSNQDYFTSGPSNLSYAQTASNDISMSHGVNTYAEPSATVNFSTHQTTATSYAQASPTLTASYTQPSVDTTSYSQPDAASTTSYTQPAAMSPKASRTSNPGTRRSLPSAARSSATETAVPLPSYAQNWPMSPPKATTTVSPTMTTDRSRKSTQTPTQAPAAPQQTAYDPTPQDAARAAIQQQHRPSPTTQAAQTVTPAQVSPFQAPVQTARAKSRTGHRASSRTPVNAEPRATPSHHTVQPVATLGTSSYNDTSLSSGSNYNTFSAKYSGATANTAAADTRIAYEPYTAQTTSATASTYPSYDSTYERNTATPVQSSSLAYTPSNNSRPGQYQIRNAQSHSNSAGPAPSSYSQTPTTTQQQTASLQSFNMRASATANNARSSSNKYQQQQSQQQPQQTQSYESYSQTQQPSAQPDPHSWYGFGSTGTSSQPTNTSGGYASRNSASSAYGGTATTSQAYQQQQQQHQQQQYGSLNMPGHNYTGDNDMYELLKLHNSGR